MSRTIRLAVMIGLVVIGITVYVLFPVEVKTGKVVKCLDDHHQGNPVIQSSLRTLRVSRKDVTRYGVVEEGRVCAKCQARLDAEERAKTAAKAVQERITKNRVAAECKFARAIFIHDAAIYACIK